MIVEFVQELPPESGPKKRADKFRDFAEVLRSKPNTWALYPTRLAPASCDQVVHAIVSGHREAFPRGEFEAVVRNDKVYVRAVTKQWL
jgi:hypothetical protein